ncbi:MAG: hypothetical protein ACLU4N_21490 [Butyricimonas faecihominis]
MKMDRRYCLSRYERNDYIADNTLKTPEAESTILIGRDRVLNAASKLKNLVQFDSKRRKYIVGEAYFEVMKDMNGLLRVTDAVRVKVYGPSLTNTNGIGTQTTLVSGSRIWGRGSVQEYYETFQLAEFGDNGEFKGFGTWT